MLEILGLPPMQNIDGRSRVPEILAAARGETAPDPEHTAIAHLDTSWGQRVDTSSPNIAIRDGHFRYVQFRSAEGKIREQLFDATNDAQEKKDHLADEPAVAERLRGEVESYLSSGPTFGDTKPLEFDELQLNQLRALGYAVP
jgi:hypothetical protein